MGVQAGGGQTGPIAASSEANDGNDGCLPQLFSAMPVPTEIQLGGRRLSLSNLQKVLYPEAGFTKGEVIEYYKDIAPVLLPHLKDRPLTLKRYPNGVGEPFFYEKRCPGGRPSWIQTAPVWSEQRGATIQYCLANDLPSLVWAANLADLELHTALAKYRELERPTVLVFDLDPGPGATVIQCCQVALWLRSELEAHQLAGLPKTSGSKGLQLYVPLNTAATFEQTKTFSKALAQRLEHRHPDAVVSRMAKRLRPGKVFIDWSQNDSHKTTVCVYSLRAKSRPTVSTPLTWGEVEKTARARSDSDLSFEAGQVLRRVQKHGDLFGEVLSVKQRLPRELPVVS